MDKCLFNKNNKGYVIPITDWLKPLEKLLIKKNNPNTVGLIMLSELMKKEKVIVKITSGNNKKIRFIDKILSTETNFIRTYCAFPCYENLTVFDDKYSNSNAYCNANTYENKATNKLITLEIMKKYKNGTLNNLINSLTVIETRKILEQLILAQFNAFFKFGFVHNDINLTNFLYTISDKNNEFIYCVCNDHLSKKDNPSCLVTSKKIYDKEIIPIIFDFDKSHCFNPVIYKHYSDDFFNEYQFDDNDILLMNLFNTIKECIKLIDKNNYKKEYEDIEKQIDSIINNRIFNDEWYKWSVKSLDKYSRNMMNWEYFRDTTISICAKFVNRIIQIFSPNVSLINNKCIVDLQFR